VIVCFRGLALFRFAPIVFGVILIAIWTVLTFKHPKPRNPSDLASLQQNPVMVIEHTSIRTALLTAGLISIAFGLT
jgi:hypothetical protein